MDEKESLKIGSDDEDKEILKFGITLFIIVLTITFTVSVILFNTDIDHNNIYNFNNNKGDCYYCDEYYYNETARIWKESKNVLEGKYEIHTS